MIKMSLKWISGTVAVSLLAGATLVIQSSRGDDRGAPPPQRQGDDERARGREPGPPPEPQSLSGTLIGFNFGPHGEPEGLLVKESGGKIIQLNFPPPIGAKVQQAVAVGDALALSGIPMRSRSDHSVYGLVSVTGAKGRKVEVGPPGGEPGHAQGTIKYLNYDRGGQVNGAVLISDDFVEIGRSAIRLNLKVGDKLTADGPAHPMPNGQQCIHADTINGQSVDRSQDQPGPGDRPRRLADRFRSPERQGSDDYERRDRASSDRGPGNADNGPDDGSPPPPRGGDRGRGDSPPPPPQRDADGRQSDGDQAPPGRGRNAPPPPPDQQ